MRKQCAEGGMSLGLILIILVIIYLLGGFSGRFGGYGYGMGHSGMGLGGVILIVLIILLLLGKLLNGQAIEIKGINSDSMSGNPNSSSGPAGVAFLSNELILGAVLK